MIAAVFIEIALRDFAYGCAELLLEGRPVSEIVQTFGSTSRALDAIRPLADSQTPDTKVLREYRLEESRRLAELLLQIDEVTLDFTWMMEDEVADEYKKRRRDAS
jgi:hypothetical protein